MSNQPLVLVVDDDPDLVESVCMKLESQNYRTAKAYDGVLEEIEMLVAKRRELSNAYQYLYETMGRGRGMAETIPRTTGYRGNSRWANE